MLFLTKRYNNMGAIATCKVRRQSAQKKEEIDYQNGFDANEMTYDAHILFFENAKAYVIKDNTKSLYWVNIFLLSDLEPIV